MIIGTFQNLDLYIGKRYVAPRLGKPGIEVKNQPVFVVRRATREEYLKDFIANNGRKPEGWQHRSARTRFYEILTD